MTMKFAPPPQAAQLRSLIEEQLAEAVKIAGEKITVEWRGGNRHLDVISMPVELVYYNPDTHRIRAQRTLDPVRDRALSEEPWGSIGQDYLEMLLKCLPSDPDKVDPRFEDLKHDLDDFGQKDPGLITQDGILVNGNTRCAALREIGAKYIRVGVLPGVTNWSDINSVELSLQLRKERKRDYSYVNELLAIDEQIGAGRRPEDVAREFRIKMPTLEKDRWVFGVIQDLIERSEGPDGAKLRLVDFEEHKGSLDELYRAYMKVKATDRDKAEQLKESRLAMLLLGFAKTDLRLVQPEFYEKYLEPKLPESIRQAEGKAAPVAIPGLPISVPDATPAVKATGALTDAILKARVSSRAGSRSTDSAITAVQTMKMAKESIERALDPAGKDIKLRQRQLAAPERLSDASDLIDLAIGDLAQARATRALDEEAFDDAVLGLRQSLARLAKQAARTFTEPGDSVAWLIETVGESQ